MHRRSFFACAAGLFAFPLRAPKIERLVARYGPNGGEWWAIFQHGAGRERITAEQFTAMRNAVPSWGQCWGESDESWAAALEEMTYG